MNSSEDIPPKTGTITEAEIKKQTLELEALDKRHNQEMAHLALTASKYEVEALGKILTTPKSETKE